jgi:Domain of unknown function (DUF5710)
VGWLNAIFGQTVRNVMPQWLRTDLVVPFGEKDDAKRLGARWDVDKRVWYCPAGVDLAKFEKWLPKKIETTFRASSYCLAESATGCWKCGNATRVYSIMVPAGSHMNVSDGDDGWLELDQGVFVFYVSVLPDDAARQMRSITSNYRLNFSNTTNSTYWMNHCEGCGMKQGDHHLFAEPDGAFLPSTPEAASNITLFPIAQPFESDGTGYISSEDLTKYMPRRALP